MHKYFHTCTGRVSVPTPAPQQQTCTFLISHCPEFACCECWQGTPSSSPHSQAGGQPRSGRALSDAACLWTRIFACSFLESVLILKITSLCIPQKANKLQPWKYKTAALTVYVSLIFFINCFNVYLFFSCYFLTCWLFLFSVSLEGRTHGWGLHVPGAQK